MERGQMKLFKSFAFLISVSTLFSASCSKATAPNSSSSAGALTANSSLNAAARPFSRLNLNASGAAYLNEFIRPEVRARLDEEPTGNADDSYDPSTAEAGVPADQPDARSAEESLGEKTSEPRHTESEEGYPGSPRLDTVKYSWARKAFGDAVKAAPTNNGVIVLYADENYYDVERLMGFVEEGRNRIADASAIPGDRIQVVFGGYRSAPQLELWVVPQGSPMPEFKAEDRSKASQAED
jgi:hypothetical protein